MIKIKKTHAENDSNSWENYDLNKRIIKQLEIYGYYYAFDYFKDNWKKISSDNNFINRYSFDENEYKNIFLILFLFYLLPNVSAQTEEICPQPTPRGWVIISVRDCAGCCGNYGEIVKMRTIKKISNLPPGETLEICPQPVPRGWVVISVRDCAGCCGYAGQLVKMQTIKKIRGLPVGTTLEICPQPIPDGWVEVSRRACAGCCGKAGELVDMLTIKKID